jgi:hypothetical protein
MDIRSRLSAAIGNAELGVEVGTAVKQLSLELVTVSFKIRDRSPLSGDELVDFGLNGPAYMKFED